MGFPVSELRGDAKDLVGSGVYATGLALESLHGVHELNLVVGVLLLESRGIDASSSPGFRGLGGSLLGDGVDRDFRAAIGFGDVGFDLHGMLLDQKFLGWNNAIEF
ncbi:hypothetical protein [Singulisphaera sp. PoT]|uniref:hypothetical protein n=1 Tax=Singulisphaera sp. PoT TaxID=3411797 RepID=UPI003BF4AC01